MLWLPALLLAWTQALYGAALRLLPARPVRAEAITPRVSLIVAAYAEEAVIATKVANALALDYPREQLEVIVACDGSPDATAELARRAGADVVLELPRGGKIRAQDQAVEVAAGEIVAFSDANALWAPDALGELVKPFADPGVGYVCGQVSFVGGEGPDGGNQEGLYWRYEMALRTLESSRWSVTAGNGAIYATRRSEYLVVDEVMGHDLSFPFNFVKRGRRAVYAPAARATERMVPTVEGEFARKRRMMSHAWPIVATGGLADLRGYPPRLRADDRQPPAAALRVAAAARLAAAGVAGARAGQPQRTAAARRPARRLLRRGRGTQRRPRRADRPVLRADDRVDRDGVAGLAAPWHPGGLGTAGGDAMRRLVDIVVSAAALAVVGVPLLLVMAAIRLESPGHPIYRQRRVGKDGVEFDVLKLRTMVAGAETLGSGMAVDEGDSRITRIGAVLRQTAIDELPQLVNVLRGDMSLIGPRPTIPVQVAQYDERQRGRLAVKPGLTGWAQVNGRAALPWSERIELDLWYIEHRSAALDVKILARTVGVLLRRDGTYRGETGGWR